MIHDGDSKDDIGEVSNRLQMWEKWPILDIHLTSCSALLQYFCFNIRQKTLHTNSMSDFVIFDDCVTHEPIIETQGTALCICYEISRYK